MKSLFSTSLKSGLIALGLVSSLVSPSFAGPILQPDLSVPTNLAAPQITPVRDEWAGGNDRRISNDWQWRRQFRGERRFARSNNWNGNWNNNDDWRWRRHHHRHFGGSDAAILGLGLGLGLGASQYYDGYDYAPPPRRHYRVQRLSSAHVQWCYDRYRSYRSFDNTFQPYNGPRQPCWSPYS